MYQSKRYMSPRKSLYGGKNEPFDAEDPMNLYNRARVLEQKRQKIASQMAALAATQAQLEAEGAKLREPVVNSPSPLELERAAAAEKTKQIELMFLELSRIQGAELERLIRGAAAVESA